MRRLSGTLCAISVLVCTVTHGAAEENCSLGLVPEVAGVGRCLASGDTFRDLPAGPEMVVVQSGAGAGLAVSRTEITFKEWDVCVTAGWCRTGKRPDHGFGPERRAVVNIWQEDVEAYLGWLSDETSEAYRLLTDAEWADAVGPGPAPGLADLPVNISEWVAECPAAPTCMRVVRPRPGETVHRAEDALGIAQAYAAFRVARSLGAP